MVGINSKLNPLANTFIPLKPLPVDQNRGVADSVKNIASKLLEDTLNSKKDSEIKKLTSADLFHLAEKLISHRYQEHDVRSIKSYLAAKLPNLITEKNLRLGVDSFDFSLFRAPKPTYLIVSFWGLYHHEQATRPTISLTKRPEILKDEVWSVKPQDYKLWNTCAKKTTCDCPPMFGYTVPTEFFGNPFKFKQNCPIACVHLNRYGEVSNGSEHLLLSSRIIHDDVFFEPLPESVSDKKEEKSLEYYSEHLKEIVSDVCNLISEFEVTDTGYANSTSFEKEEKTINADSSKSSESYWDEKEPDSKASNELDDDSHSLFDVIESESDEGVPNEIQVMLHNSLSRSFSSNSERDFSTRSNSSCDPPCSSWCHTIPALHKSTEIINLLKDTSDFLLSTKQGLPINTLEENDRGFQKPIYKRSFSANDCDPRNQNNRLEIIQPIATREALKFLRKDPINFFKSIRKRDESWMDSDSGISCNWSSQEEVFSEKENLSDSGLESNKNQDRTPMWNLFVGEGSLWQPLAETSASQANKIPQKPGREIQRQKSVN